MCRGCQICRQCQLHNANCVSDHLFCLWMVNQHPMPILASQCQLCIQTMPNVQTMPIVCPVQCHVCTQCQLCTQCHLCMLHNAKYATGTQLALLHNWHCKWHCLIVNYACHMSDMLVICLSYEWYACHMSDIEREDGDGRWSVCTTYLRRKCLHKISWNFASTQILDHTLVIFVKMHSRILMCSNLFWWWHIWLLIVEVFWFKWAWKHQFIMWWGQLI